MRSLFLFFSALLFLSGCGKKKIVADAALLQDTDLLHRNMKQLTEVIIHDAFSPPVASRIYAYTSLAAYEASRFEKPGFPSLTAQLNGFEAMPAAKGDGGMHHLLAATKAFFTVAERITFSKDTLAAYQQKVYEDFRSLLDEETYKNSLAWGEAVGLRVFERTKKDNYKETRGMPKFLGMNEEGKWRPTQPDYLDAAEPYWASIKPMVIDSSAAFKCPAPVPYSTDKSSAFYKQVEEVYTITRNLTDEQKLIARYWDDNPFVIEHSGHLMFANKKITPVGHWIGITSIASKMKKLGLAETAQLYALTAVAIFDSFITCWEEKFRTQVLRPVTVINDWIDRNWQPYLQTPPFPEYTSGHSGISAAAATILTRRIGDNFAFEDTSDLEYIGLKRKFPSFHAAAQEASISRVYGGIHYRRSVDAGAHQGTKIAEFMLNKLDLE